ncbi:OmpA family protein [Pantanalinema sp. GBBB05]|uniref:OmpA family protein n=1 Tax=Pantanalinema sp. GBBB05 TaxID=2604139 RepID=UPI003D81578C
MKLQSDSMTVPQLVTPALAHVPAVLAGVSIGWLLISPALANSAKQPSVVPPYRVMVNSGLDGVVQADDAITLREAMLIVNGRLPLDQLSASERSQVTPLEGPVSSQIEFNLPSDQTTISLQTELPPLERPGTVLDGSTQPGYAANRSAINEMAIPVPIVAITPATGKEIFRGLTVSVEGVVIRGLSLYGFTATGDLTATTPPADIFIAHRFPPPDISQQPTPANFAPFYKDDRPATTVTLENNWLGIAPRRSTAAPLTATDLYTQASPRSAFGVYVFNGKNVEIRRNWIAHHDASAIITSVNAEQLQVNENVLTSNGLAGMPDAIRLEGQIAQSQITGNLVCGNDGSGVYLFKPQGSVQITNNQITFNGRRFRRAAIYLMGNNHQVTGNQIVQQAGPGVVVAAYPQSRRNQIGSNRFSALEGLSIDLVTEQGTAGTGVTDYQRGDGANPARNTNNRRIYTGNAAIDAPQFVSREFFALSQTTTASESPLLQATNQAQAVQVFGQADPRAQIELYRVTGQGDYGALTEPIATTEADDTGKFEVTLSNLRIGDRISAIATLPDTGTSEPAVPARIRTATGTALETPTAQPPSSPPTCVTPFQQPPQAEIPPSTPIRLTVPNKIHFALDQATISATTARVLDRIAEVLQANPTILVDIEGHTDPRASDAYNLQLGLRRARAARDYLLRQGIANERMTIRSFGEQRLLTPGRDRVDYARDRRVEFMFRDIREIDVVVQEEDLQIEGGNR